MTDTTKTGKMIPDCKGHSAGDPPTDRGPIVGIPQDDLADLLAERDALQAKLDAAVSIVQSTVSSLYAEAEWWQDHNNQDVAHSLYMIAGGLEEHFGQLTKEDEG